MILIGLIVDGTVVLSFVLCIISEINERSSLRPSSVSSRRDKALTSAGIGLILIFRFCAV